MGENNIFTNYLSLIKFCHTIFALPFAFIGFFLAIRTCNYNFEWKIFILMLLCMLFARNAAMSFNRYIDRKIDTKNPRTATREIPVGTIKQSSALLFVIGNSVLFIICTFFINNLVFYLSPIALFIILGYSYTKRFTALCHFILGLGLSLAPIGAYLTVTGKFDFLPLIFSFIVLFWVSGFDIIYALLDVEFDKSEQLKSIPVFLGNKNAMLISILVHTLAIIGVILAGYMADFGIWYWLGAIMFTCLLIYQHIIVKPNNLKQVNMAFFTLNGIASLIFATFVILDIFFNLP